jgi:hypothetical protein
MLQVDREDSLDHIDPHDQKFAYLDDGGYLSSAIG